MSQGTRLGFIGLGAMGRPMVLNLLRSGFAVDVWARQPEAAQPLIEAGASLCVSPADVARRADVVFASVTSSADVEQIALGTDGLIEGFSAGSIFVDMSSIAPTVTRMIARRLSEVGVEMIDAPVSGGVQGAIDGALVIMAGGKCEVLERVQPMFSVLGKKVVHIGEIGAGQVAKLCNQMVMVNTIQAVAEALHFASAAGVDPAAVWQALTGGSAGSRVLEVSGKRMVEGNFTGGMVAASQHKDYGILMSEAFRSGVPLPVAGQVWQQLNVLMGQGWGGDDTANLLRVLELSGNGR